MSLLIYLLMLLFLACRHNWNKVMPPSTSDRWECCLLSMLPFKQNHCGLFFIQSGICYLRYYTRQFFPTTVVVSAALVAFAQQQLSGPNIAWSAGSVIEECAPYKSEVRWLNWDPTILDWSFHVYLTRCVPNVPFHFWLHQAILSLELRNRMLLAKILDFCHHS